MLHYVECHSVFREKIFKNVYPYLSGSRLSLLSIKKNLAFHFCIFIRLSIRMLCAKFGLNLPGGFREKKIKIWQVFRRINRKTDRQNMTKRQTDDEKFWAFSSDDLKPFTFFFPAFCLTYKVSFLSLKIYLKDFDHLFLFFTHWKTHYPLVMKYIWISVLIKFLIFQF